MYNLIKAIIIVGLLAVTVILGKGIYDKSTPLSLREEAEKLFNMAVSSDGVTKISDDTTPEFPERDKVKGQSPQRQSLLSQKKLKGAGPYLDEEDKKLTRLATGADVPGSTTTPSGPGIVEHSSTIRSAGPSEGQTMNLEDGRVEKIESFYSKAASVLEGME